MEDLFEFVYELGKWGRGEGEEKGKKSDPSHQLSLPIEWRLIVQRGWVSEAEEDDEDEEEEPPRIIKYGDEGHDSNSDEKNSSAPSSKERIGDMASI
jgi:hypothetical protein